VALLCAAGIGVAVSETATGEAAAVSAAERVGYPVVVKAAGPDIVHKTEIRGVLTNLEDAGAVRDAWRDLKSRLGDRLTGVVVQEMVRGGVEMLIGAVEDPTFGPVIACATGGTMAEVLADSQFRLHPLGDSDAVEMIGSLRGAVLLAGHRGAPPADRDALAEALQRLSALVGLCPEIVELDINPLAVLPKGVRALDVRVKVEPPRPRSASRRVRY
jgi:acyl-CoA synthetase (NDP forming)